MLCPNCKKEIENGSAFCEHCGARMKKSRKALWITLSIVFVLVAGVVLLFTQNKYEVSKDYVDLGLPSGTLWKNTNEGGDGAYYTYDEAVKNFGSKIATKVQWEELKDYCTWSWTGYYYKVIGPNGNSITLPAAGYRHCEGEVLNVGSYGSYWSSSPNFDFVNGVSWCLSFNSSEVFVTGASHCFGLSVRLVQ